jgi:Zn-dependent M28 family amino/carboxypeptidase
MAQPTTQKNHPSTVHVDEARLRAHVETLSKSFSPRSYRETDNLNKCAAYILTHFVHAGAIGERQEFTVEGRTYVNVIGRFGKEKTRQIIIGAHYDAVQGTPGADDNASGVAGLIELAYLIGKGDLDKGIELVAYSLEEPPFFGTDMMGSVVHAASIEHFRRIEGVIVLEMIGYYEDRWGSQSYPMPLLNILYPNRGNYIAIVGRTDQREFTRRVKTGMKGATDLPVYSLNAPEFLPGVDFSDHRNYWGRGFNALMITDTAFYRNKAYHKADDTAERLDFARMAKVVVSIFEAIKSL